MTSLKIPAALSMSVLALFALLALVAAAQPAHAQTSEEFAFRVAARLHTDGEQLEFGIQRLDDDGRPRGLHLEQRRFIALDREDHRWLTGDDSFLRRAPHYEADGAAAVDGANVRVVVRLNPSRGLFEFGAQYELDASQLPDSDVDGYAPAAFDRKRFFPAGVEHHRWLYTGAIRFTRVWSDDAIGATAPADIETAARTHLAAELSVDEADLALDRSEGVVWSDASLGCPQEGMAYAQVLTPGYRLIFAHAGLSYAVHTNDDGSHMLTCGDDGAVAADIEAAARTLLANDLGVGEDELRLESAEAVSWSDASLGCPQEGMSYAQVITPGYRLIFNHRGTAHAVHTNDDGSHMVICGSGG